MIDDQWLEAANCVIKRMREQLDTARTASAAWKASAKFHRRHEEAAEQRVAELEELLSDRETDLGFEYDRGNDMEKRVTELEDALEEVRDLARTGTPPAAYGMTSLAEWEHYKINRVAGMADFAINK